MSEPILCPFTVLCHDQAEQPYRFRSLTADGRAYGSKAKGGEDLIVRTSPTTLVPGESQLPVSRYSIEGMAGVDAGRSVMVERKTLGDWYLACGHHREELEARLEALAQCRWSAVVIEATLEEIATQPPPLSKLLPKTAYRSLLAWSVRYGLPIFTAGPRDLAEVTTFRLLERAWKEAQDAG